MRLATWIVVLALLVLLYTGRDVVGANLGLSKVLNRSKASGVHPELQLALDEWDGPFAIKVLSGVRTDAQQKVEYAKGRTTVGPNATTTNPLGDKVTEASTVESTAHGRGAAIDVAPAPNGFALFNVNDIETRSMYEAMHAHFIARGFTVKIKLADGSIDWPHVQFYNWRSLPYPAPDYDAAYKGSVSV